MPPNVVAKSAFEGGHVNNSSLLQEPFYDDHREGQPVLAKPQY